MSQRTSSIVLAVVISPLAAYFAILAAMMIEALISGANPLGAIDIAGAIGVASLIFIYPSVLIVGVPLYLALEKLGFRSAAAYAIAGAIAGAVIAALIFRDLYFVVYGTVGGAAVATVFRMIVSANESDSELSSDSQ